MIARTHVGTACIIDRYTSTFHEPGFAYHARKSRRRRRLYARAFMQLCARLCMCLYQRGSSRRCVPDMLGGMRPRDTVVSESYAVFSRARMRASAWPTFINRLLELSAVVRRRTKIANCFLYAEEEAAELCRLRRARIESDSKLLSRLLQSFKRGLRKTLHLRVEKLHIRRMNHISQSHCIVHDFKTNDGDDSCLVSGLDNRKRKEDILYPFDNSTLFHPAAQ